LHAICLPLEMACNSRLSAFRIRHIDSDRNTAAGNRVCIPTPFRSESAFWAPAT
jgi:hypothetical protein